MTSLIETLGQSARAASNRLAAFPDAIIAKALNAAAGEIIARQDFILSGNKKDIDFASSRGATPALLDRLTLTSARIEAIANSVEMIAALPDPAGKVIAEWSNPGNNLRFKRVAVPLGVLGIIYESRPNVTADAIALSVKSRNCAILRGGSESLNSSLALFSIFKTVFQEHGLPEGCIGFVNDMDREHVGAMLAASDYIDVIVPRGGKSLTERVMNEARMPVFAHLDGICHTYIHASADPDMARRVVLNAKMRRPGICGATETLLIDENFPAGFAKLVIADLLKAGCAIVGDDRAQALDPAIEKAAALDWSTEYLDAKISVKMVSGVEVAVDHIN